MVGTIVRIIEASSKKSIQEGISKYESYFVKTNKYIKYKNDVDDKLIKDGFSDVIPKE